MIPARKIPFFVRWFSAQVEKRITQTFSRVHMRELEQLSNALNSGPALVVSNHTAWWDPMFSILIGHRLLRADSFAMMDAENLERLPFLGRVGGFGVYLKDPVDRRRVLRYTAKLLNDAGRLVWIFPEGRERPRSIGVDEFLPGAAMIARLSPKTAVVPVGIRYEFLGREHPEAFVSIGEPLRRVNDIDSACRAQRQAVQRELEKIDEVIREPTANNGFEVILERPPSRGATFAERLLAILTRYR